MFNNKKYLIIAGLLGTMITLNGCGSSSGSSEDIPEQDPGKTTEYQALYNEGSHAAVLSARGTCFACHDTTGEGLLNTDATYEDDAITQSQQYNTCITCHYDIHSDYHFDKASANSCSQCHDPHAATKFNQNTANTITAQWSTSGHADFAGLAFSYDFADDCLTCHSGNVFATAVSGVPQDEIDTSGGAQVVACGTCHDLLARNDTSGDFELGALRNIDSVHFPSGADVTIDAGNNLCLVCHQGRSSTPTVDERIAAGNLSFSNIHYAAAGATLMGGEARGGYEYPGRKYRARNTFAVHASDFFDKPELTTCTGCHMNAGAADHSFSVPVDNCTDCHFGASFEALSGSPSLNFNHISALKNQLKTLLESSGVTVTDSYPYFSDITTEGQLKAAYNLQFASKDNGSFIHNGIYVRQLLYDAIVDMGGTPVRTRPVVN